MGYRIWVKSKRWRIYYQKGIKQRICGQADIRAKMETYFRSMLKPSAVSTHGYEAVSDNARNSMSSRSSP